MRKRDRKNILEEIESEEMCTLRGDDAGKMCFLAQSPTRGDLCIA